MVRTDYPQVATSAILQSPQVTIAVKGQVIDTGTEAFVLRTAAVRNRVMRVGYPGFDAGNGHAVILETPDCTCAFGSEIHFAIRAKFDVFGAIPVRSA